MPSAFDQLSGLQRRVSARNENVDFRADLEAARVYLAPINGLFHVEFYGMRFDEAFQDCITTLSRPEVAVSIRSLAFRGPDKGANGTRNWDFTDLVDAGTEFLNLNSLFVEPTSPEHHNHTIIAQVYEEDGMIARLVAKMPSLLFLTLPSAPNQLFFSLSQHPLQILRIDSGYDHQNFILSLSKSSCFPDLRFLDFGDQMPQGPDDPVMPTPLADYSALVQSQAFHKVGRLNLRNASLSSDQTHELVRLKPGLQLFLIQAQGHYVR